MIACMGAVRRVPGKLDRFQQRHAVLGFPLAVRQKFADDQGGYLAASVTYYAFFSIFPLLLVLVTLLGYALEGDPDLQRRVLDSALADFPVIGPQLEDNVHSLQGNAFALAVGIGVAIWAGTGVALALENALDHIWGVPIRRRVNPLLARVRALVWIALLGAITILGTVLGSASAVASYGPAVRVLALVVSFAINLGVFLAVFRVLTSHRPSWREVLPGALVAAFAWEVLQTAGGYIVDHQLRHASSTYGVFAIVIGLLSWIYLASSVTLIAAEVNVVISHKLWPRSLSMLGEQPLTGGDADALRRRAGVEERRADEDIQVVFEPPERKSLSARRPGNEPTMPRALWSGAISFGLVNAPVRMYTAIQEHNVHFNLVHKKTAARIHYRKVTDSNREVADDQIVKGYEISDGKYVTLTDEEIAAAHVEGDKVIEIHAFVPFDEIDPIVFERAYYLGPAEGSERVYSLLAKALETSGLVGIASFVFHDRDRLVCLRVKDDVIAARAHVLRGRDPRPRRDPARPQALGRQARAEARHRSDRAHEGHVRSFGLPRPLPRAACSTSSPRSARARRSRLRRSRNGTLPPHLMAALEASLGEAVGRKKGSASGSRNDSKPGSKKASAAKAAADLSREELLEACQEGQGARSLEDEQARARRSARRRLVIHASSSARRAAVPWHASRGVFLAREVALWMLLYPLYLLTREGATGAFPTALRHAREVVAAERSLGSGHRTARAGAHVVLADHARGLRHLLRVGVLSAPGRAC